ncbi:DUF2515 domain-containing protein [Cytobacillus solani]|uniref:DUF2515 domain-containing protein n=1 Tax=Cytobacillus solani TaxID=1637975 RepID=A0A0Q3QR97_9BACI|nr:DUF2515 domain-containing protein [Cytobacillus solani]KOP83203.1 hypothetical protein AMS60_12395 [Bacillus sp. FJAT-21945]KQL20230.1 hypothetical protein AN957_17705 [Cytobacillus solani]USK53485.1 DUF2515 domain-containing protein [Cytobacillus solani]
MFYQKGLTLKQLSVEEIELITQINKKTKRCNMDNISRTKAYHHYYSKNPEIKWSFLASMVSRNAGWNMCDLEGTLFLRALDKGFRKKLFFTYERANWLIFQDAFPQLLLYQYSTKIKRPMFHLLKFFHVSSFMEREWQMFWEERHVNRLMTSLIINEQNVIQKPVIKHPVYESTVFRSFLFFFQDWLHFSSVIFPTCEGELFGASVNGFKSVSKRIDLGKRLADILFEKMLYPRFYEFAYRTEHTGSRFDYEQYFAQKKIRTTPFLRCTYPIVKHHRHDRRDWSRSGRIKKKWIKEMVDHKHPIQITDWYEKKQDQLKKGVYLSEWVKSNK